MAMATLRASAAQDSLRVGERMPELEGQTLTGRTAVLPQASAGKVTLVAMGFTYKSRFPIEAWAEWYRTTIDPTTAVTFFGPHNWGMVSYSTSHEDDAYLIVLNRQGVVRWLHHGVFDQSWPDELKGLLTSLAGRHRVAADPDHPDRRSEP